MKSPIIYCSFLILFPSIKAEHQDFQSTFHLEQERIRCLGVPCPYDKPNCIVESHVAKCVADNSPNNINRNDNNRLSRAPPGSLSNNPPLVAATPKPDFNENPFHALIDFQNKPQNNLSPLSYVPNFCFQSKDPGRCRAFFVSFYFNQNSGKCETFVYGGCSGNNNRFRYERDCKVTCEDPFHKVKGQMLPRIPVTTAMPTAPVDIQLMAWPKTCNLHADSGPCSTYVVRFYFNKNTRRCEEFTYGGCQGNANNFESLSACLQMCDDATQNTEVSSNIGQSTDSLFSFKPLSQLLPFNLLGYGASTETPFLQQSLVENNNIVQSVLGSTFDVFGGASEKRPSCLVPKKVGPCRARIPRYFFNNRTGSCEQFFFGGCQPNENNFQSEQDCLSSCKSFNGGRKPMSMTDVHPFPFWRDPANDATFREFLIRRRIRANNGNMMGAATTNHFVCTQPVNQGSCFEKIQSYFFNSQTGICEPFVFRGCGGNRNRFKTLESCQKFCLTK